MGKKYICEVRKDNNNKELELINSTGSAIKFSTQEDMNTYFNNYCVSEERIKNNVNNSYGFIFIIFFIIIIIAILFPMFNNGNGNSDNLLNNFGRFSF